MNLDIDIKILVATHKDYWMPQDSIYIPIQVGAIDKNPIGYITDDYGFNISEKNANFCELTGLYWAWKNLKADYIGLVHYRRYFTHKNHLFNIKLKRKQILNSKDWCKLLEQYPVIVAGKRRYYIESNRSHYNHAHPRDGLDYIEQVIQDLYPEYLPSFEIVMKRTWAHMFNMFVMRSDFFDEYMTWLFDILFELERRLDIKDYDSYQARVYGFVAERLLDVWLECRGIPYKEQHVSFMESQNWLKKGGDFLKRKVWGR